MITYNYKYSSMHWSIYSQLEFIGLVCGKKLLIGNYWLKVWQKFIRN